MNRSPLARLLVVLVGTLGIGLGHAACVGSDPDPVSAPPGSDAGPSSVDGASGGVLTGEAGAEAGGGYDAGPPIWGELPTGSTLAFGSAAVAGCTFELLARSIGVAPPQYELYLEKRESPGMTCEGPKGVRSLGVSYHQPPNGRLLAHPATRSVVMAYNAKASASGSAAVSLSVSQVDLVSGNDLHLAQMKTKAVMGEPVLASLPLTALFFGDATEQAAGTIRVQGEGVFPGASGAGAKFQAMYAGFVVSAPALPVAADTASQSD